MTFIKIFRIIYNHQYKNNLLIQNMLQPTLASKFDITGDNIRSNKADLKAEIHFIG